MPFIRFTRDKRGNETTIVMHSYRGLTGAAHGKVLYLFHSPSQVKLGREPLDGEVREALEHTHPDLTFDWESLLRDSSASRSEARDRPRPQGRPRGPGGADSPPRPGGGDRRPQPQAPPQPAVLVDETLLGRTLGAETAFRMRRSYQDLVDRITRRSRTPEDRDRLIELASRLNPDEWADEAAVRSGAVSFDRSLGELAASLPSRRRGRRGGRRFGRPDGRFEPAATTEAGASAIIDSGDPGDDDAGSTTGEGDGPDRDPLDRGDLDTTGGTDPESAAPAPGPAGDLSRDD